MIPMFAEIRANSSSVKMISQTQIKISLIQIQSCWKGKKRKKKDRARVNAQTSVSPRELGIQTREEIGIVNLPVKRAADKEQRRRMGRTRRINPERGPSAIPSGPPSVPLSDPTRRAFVGRLDPISACLPQALSPPARSPADAFSI